MNLNKQLIRKSNRNKRNNRIILNLKKIKIFKKQICRVLFKKKYQNNQHRKKGLCKTISVKRKNNKIKNFKTTKKLIRNKKK